MTARKLEIVEAIQNGIDPFAFYRPEHKDVDFQGWRSEHHFLSSVVEELRPRTIVEVGVWKGGSVITMAKKLQSLHLDSAIIAVDTWRGSPEHWCQPGLWELMNVKNGVPGLYETFMSNIMSKSLQEYVVPLPVDSMSACEILKRKGIRPELIHIDAGHEYDSVMTDLRIWSELLAPAGSIIMDDYDWDDETQEARSWADVARAVNESVIERSSDLNFKHADGKCVLTFKK